MAETTATTSRMAILSIVYRAVCAVGADVEMSAKDMIAVAEPLADKIVEMAALQGGMTGMVPTLVADGLDTYLFLDAVLDTIEETIPVVRGLNMTLTTSRFAERVEQRRV